MNKWVSIAISSLITFLLSVATAYQALDVVDSWPSKQKLAGILVGSVGITLRGLQQQLSPPPQ